MHSPQPHLVLHKISQKYLETPNAEQTKCCFLCNVHSPFHFPSAHMCFWSNEPLLANGQSHEKCNNKLIEFSCQHGVNASI